MANQIMSRDGYSAGIRYTMVKNHAGEKYCLFFAVPESTNQDDFIPGFYSREEAEYWLSVKRNGGKAIYRLVANRGDLFEYRYFIVSSDYDDDIYQGEFIPGFSTREGAIAWWTNSVRKFQKRPERKAHERVN